jgi:hypothetical protein
MVAGALVVTGTVAAADPIENEGNDQYRHAMDYFVPELGRWATELAQTVEALPVKPDLAEDLPELAYRGMLMKFDLEGTQAPDEMTDAHEKLVFAMGQLTEVAQIAVDDPAGADLLMGQYMSLLRWSISDRHPYCWWRANNYRRIHDRGRRGPRAFAACGLTPIQRRPSQTRDASRAKRSARSWQTA